VGADQRTPDHARVRLVVGDRRCTLLAAIMESVTVLDEFAAARPHDVLWRGNEWLVDATAASDLIADATRRGVKVLETQGFLVVDEATYPALSRIVDFSNESSKVAARKALKLLNDDWANPPTPADQMPPAAT